MTNDELNRLVCERVLGWTWRVRIDEVIGWVKDAKLVAQSTPNFCGDWRAFGLLWDALVKADNMPSINNSGAAEYVYAEVFGNGDGDPLDAADPDPRRALVLAALKAYGVEVS